MLIDNLLSENKMENGQFTYDNIVNLYEQTSFKDWQEVQGETYLKNNNIEQQKKDYEDREELAQEIFEWWVVDEWMAQKLIDQGEPVLKNDYGYWWGRTTTGQAISLDSVIEAIYILD